MIFSFSEWNCGWCEIWIIQINILDNPLCTWWSGSTWTWLAGSLGHCDLWREWSFQMSLSRKCWKLEGSVSDGKLGSWAEGEIWDTYDTTFFQHCKIWYNRDVAVIETVWFSRMIVRQSDAQHIRFDPTARISCHDGSIVGAAGAYLSHFKPWKAKGLSFQPFDRRSSIPQKQTLAICPFLAISGSMMRNLHNSELRLQQSEIPHQRWNRWNLLHRRWSWNTLLRFYRWSWVHFSKKYGERDGDFTKRRMWDYVITYWWCWFWTVC